MPDLNNTFSNILNPGVKKVEQPAPPAHPTVPQKPEAPAPQAPAPQAPAPQAVTPEMMVFAKTIADAITQGVNGSKEAQAKESRYRKTYEQELYEGLAKDTKDFMAKKQAQTELHFKKVPYTILQIPLHSNLFPKTGDPDLDRELAVWEVTFNFKPFKVRAGETAYVPLQVYNHYMGVTIGKLRGPKGKAEGARFLKSIQEDTLMKSLPLFDYLKRPWETSPVNPKSPNFDPDYDFGV